MPDGTAALFDPKHLLEIHIEMAPADWDVLRRQHHDLLATLGPERLTKPEPKPYTVFKADVTIDGVTLKGVGLRKRGFLGSASLQRPSLGIRFDEFEQKKSFSGLARMSLNNNLQDPSLVHQSIAYRVFAAAGVPSPRCSLARVTVNGKYLGIYSHVEAVEKEFLKRKFGEASGNLYEGQISDFRPIWVRTFQKKNHKQTDSRADLEAVVKALQSDDAHLLARLEPLVDIDEYLTYWAVETVVGHWDSYSNNGNNFLIYALPASGKFQFIPWGADSVLGDPDPFTRFKRPESLQDMSLLPRRLYQLPATRERYREKLRQVLKVAWNEAELLAEVDRLEAMVEGRVHVSTSHFQAGLKKVRQFIRTRREVLEKELAGPVPEWSWALKESCSLEKAGTFQAIFQGTWQNKPDLGEIWRSSATISVVQPDKTQESAGAGVSITPAEDARNAGFPVISLVSLRFSQARLQLPILVVQPEFYKPGATLKIDGSTVSGILIDSSLLGGKFALGGLFVGTLKLLEAGTKPGQPVSGKVEADIYRFLQ